MIDKTGKSVLILAGLVALSLGIPAIAGIDDDEAPLAVAVIERSGVTVRAAIATALETYPGTVYEYELEEDDDRYLHEIEIANTETKRKHKVLVDAETGEIVSVESSRASSWFRQDEDIAATKEINKHAYSVMDAINQFAADDQVLVSEVEFKSRQGISYFEVETMGAKGEEKHLVDVATKRVIPHFRK